MKYQEAKDRIDSFPEGTTLRLTGYFDFPNRDTDRIGKVVSYDTEAVTINEGNPKDLKVLSYDKIIRIEADQGFLRPPTER